MITFKSFLMGREKDYPLTEEMVNNSHRIINKINELFSELKIFPVITSGYRPGIYNERAKGAANSPHLNCEAIDIADHDGKIKKKITLKLLEKYDLYMEDPASTVGWVHLQTRKTKSGKRIFKP